MSIDVWLRLHSEICSVFGILIIDAARQHGHIELSHSSSMVYCTEWYTENLLSIQTDGTAGSSAGLPEYTVLDGRRLWTFFSKI